MAIDTNKLPFEELTAITSLDGRYRGKISSLASYVSEYALIKTRFEVETKYLIALSKIGVVRKLSEQEEKQLLKISDISLETARDVKKYEEEIRHDVKALEKVFRNLLKETSLFDVVEKIHIGITSEDVNNLSYRLLLKRTSEEICIPQMEKIINELLKIVKEYKSTPMLARTHGQPAVPTTLGKEIAVFLDRLWKEVKILKQAKLSGKWGGAVGNMNALSFSFPEVDWISFSEKFVSSLGFKPNPITTQINTYEDIIFYFQIYQRINYILIDLNQDIWRYISDGWFVQEKKQGEVGSSTMPQKINPIDFENSEGNLGLANALIEHFTRKLPISRLQRDLSDSTTIRNIGSILGYSLLAYNSLAVGINRIKPNIQKMQEDLFKDWTILAEGVQTLLRKTGVSDPYTLMKDLTRGENKTQDEWLGIVNSLSISTSDKEKIKKLTPALYIGYSEILCDKIVSEITSVQKK